MPVLIDTSVWIRYLSGNSEYMPQAQRLLENDKAMGHELVYGELLMGDPGGRLQLLSDYKEMLWATHVSFAELRGFVLARKLHSRGIGWIDAHLLASAMVEGVPLWAADPRLRNVAEELGVAYS